MSKRNIPEAEFIGHPFRKIQLRIIDSFEPKKPLRCPACSTSFIETVRVVNSEYPGGIQYHVLNCSECPEPQWFLLK